MPIDYEKFIHPQDRKALAMLKKVPMFDTVLKTYMSLFDENAMRGVNMASKIRLSPTQIPKIYKVLPEICSTLGIPEPEFYLEMNPLPNAYTFGDTHPFIVITSGLVDMLDEDEIKPVIAHECGHILCRHVLYHSLAMTVLKLGIDFFGVVGQVAMPLYWSLMYWSRRSELSADRVAAYMMKDCDCVIRLMMRLSGGSKKTTGELNMAEYLKQAETYSREMDESRFNRLLQAWQIKDQAHPFAGIRSCEVKAWFEQNRDQLPEEADAPQKLTW